MKFVCIGDSLTFGYRVSRSKVWTKLFADKYQIEVVNRGINGDTTAGMLSRFEKDVVSQNPTHVLIMGGTNDYIMGSSLAMVRLNISTIVHQAVHNNIVPIIGIQILTDPAEAKSNWSNITDFNKINQEITRYREWVFEFAKIFNVDVIDFYKYFDDHLKMSSVAAMYIDGLHPTIEGNRVMAEAIKISKA